MKHMKKNRKKITYVMLSAMVNIDKPKKVINNFLKYKFD